MRKVFLIGSITMLMTGCVAPFPPLPGYDVAGGGTPQEYYDDGPYYGNRPYYGGRYYGNRPYYGGRYYGNRPYYGPGDITVTAPTTLIGRITADADPITAATLILAGTIIATRTIATETITTKIGKIRRTKSIRSITTAIRSITTTIRASA